MTFMDWRSQYETGHARIDEQHQALVARVNQLHEASQRGRGREEVRNTLMFLISYTLEHFKMEEELMDQTGYPQAQRHKELHHGLVVRLSELMQTYVSLGPGALTLSTMDFMAGWLVEHFQGEDCRLAEFLRER
jgi:hemerythrin-like metal-binding protein